MHRYTRCNTLQSERSALTDAANAVYAEISKARRRAARFIKIEHGKTYWHMLRHSDPGELSAQRQAMSQERDAAKCCTNPCDSYNWHCAWHPYGRAKTSPEVCTSGGKDAHLLGRLRIDSCLSTKDFVKSSDG